MGHAVENQQKETSQKEKRRDKRTGKKKRGGKRGGHGPAETVPTMKVKTEGSVVADTSSAKGEESKGSVVDNVGAEEVKDQKVDQRGQKRKREDDSEVEIDIYKIHHASDSYPEGDDEESSKEQSHVEERERIDLRLEREIRDGGATGEGEQPPQLDPQIETDGGAVSTGLLELEKLLGVATQATSLQKPDVLPQERGSDGAKRAESVINDRLFDYDSNASDSEGGLHMRHEDSSDISMSLDSSAGDASNDSSEGSSDVSASEQDSDSDEEATEEATSTEPSQAVPPRPTNQVSTNPANASNTWNRNSIQKQKNTCKSFMRTGNCKYGSNCRYSHNRINMSTSAPKLPQALAEEQASRISLYERLLQKDREKENELVVRAVAWLFREGVLQKPANAEELEKENQSEEKPREGRGGGRGKTGSGWRHGGRGRVGGRRRGGGGGGGGRARGVGGGGRRGRAG